MPVPLFLWTKVARLALARPVRARVTCLWRGAIDYILPTDTTYILQSTGKPVMLAETLHELFIQRGVEGKVAFHELAPMVHPEADLTPSLPIAPGFMFHLELC